MTGKPATEIVGVTETMSGPLSEVHTCECGNEYKVFAMFAIDQGKCSECTAKVFLKENPTIVCADCGKTFKRELKDYREGIGSCVAHKDMEESK